MNIYVCVCVHFLFVYACKLWGWGGGKEEVKSWMETAWTEIKIDVIEKKKILQAGEIQL